MPSNLSQAPSVNGSVVQIVAAMSTFFLAMTLNPEAQERAQKEIESVVGRDRLPTIDDRDQLPYVGSLVKEVLRWAPPAPLGTPTVCHPVCSMLIFCGTL